MEKLYLLVHVSFIHEGLIFISLTQDSLIVVQVSVSQEQKTSTISLATILRNETW